MVVNGPRVVQDAFNQSSSLLYEQTVAHYRTMVRAAALHLVAPVSVGVCILGQSKVQGMVLMSVIMLFDLILIAAVVPIVRRIESNKDKILKVRKTGGGAGWCRPPVTCHSNPIPRSFWMFPSLWCAT